MFIGLQKLVARASNSRIGRELAGSLGLKIASAGLTFLVTVILARTLGPADYGVYAYIYALVSLLSVPSEFGLPQLVVRETARGVSRGDYATVQGIWRWAGRTTALLSFSLVAITLIVLWLFKEPLAGKKFSTFIWALALVPLVSLGDLRGAALRGLQRVMAGQLPEFLIRPGLHVFLLAGAALIWDGSLTAPDAMFLYVLAAGLSFAVGAWLLWRVTPLEAKFCGSFVAFEHLAAGVYWWDAIDQSTGFRINSRLLSPRCADRCLSCCRSGGCSGIFWITVGQHGGRAALRYFLYPGAERKAAISCDQ